MEALRNLHGRAPKPFGDPTGTCDAPQIDLQGHTARSRSWVMVRYLPKIIIALRARQIDLPYGLKTGY